MEAVQTLYTDARRQLQAHVVYPGIVWIRGEGEVFAALDRMRELQWNTPEALSALQDARLLATLRYAMKYSPYYRDRLGTGRLSAGDLAFRLEGLPLLSKVTVQEHAEAIRVRHPPLRVTRKITGGSTGQAVTIHKDRAAIAREMAASWLGYGWYGIRIGDRAARFWGSPRSMKRWLRYACADFAMHRIRFSAFAFDEEDLERYWRDCLRFRPRYFYGYVSMLEAFARHVRQQGHDGRVLQLKAIVTTSEVLTPPQRDLLQETFGAPVQNEYGCGEVGPIAYECERGSLHVMSTNLKVEVLRQDGSPSPQGETGEIVVTDLNNRAMPLIRYRVGDFGIWGERCTCGRGFPVLEKIWGREYDFVQLPNGRRYHGEFLMYLFEDLRASELPIMQFQVSQTAASTIEARVILPDGAGPATLDKIRHALEKRLPDLEVRLEQVNAIERAASGKMRVVVNPWLHSTQESPLGAGSQSGPAQVA